MVHRLFFIAACAKRSCGVHLVQLFDGSDNVFKDFLLLEGHAGDAEFAFGLKDG